jgi:2-polyprenyl-3-methyl-5-hydroxy-6-metoxy-1,4-benzoquinol methylase
LTLELTKSVLTMSGSETPASVEHLESGEAQYFGHRRDDILELVPKSCRSVLSVGCGSGRTEEALVKQGKRVLGLELDPGAASLARQRGVEVIEGDVSVSNPELGRYRFDCLIYADVLEHLVDPLLVLRSHVECLERGGVVIISVPNFRKYEVARALFVRGHIRYVDAGVFDRTHLRITTRKMVEEWISAAGLHRTGTVYRIAMRRERWLGKIALGILNEFLATQVIVLATKPAEDPASSRSPNAM